MIVSKVHIKNFKSIIDLTLDLSQKQRAVNKNDNIISFLEPTSKIEDRTVPVLNIYGANASGKSNIIKAIKIFQRLVLFGLESDMYEPNRLKNIEEPTLIEMDFFVDKNKFHYELLYNDKSIIEERLYDKQGVLFEINNLVGKFAKIKTNVNSREFINKIYNENTLVEKDGLLYQRKTFLNTIVHRLPRLNAKLFKVLRAFAQELVIFESEDKYVPMASLDFLSMVEGNENYTESCNKITSLVKAFDIDIAKFDCESKEVLKEEINKEQSLKYFKPMGRTILGAKIVPYMKDIEGNEKSFDFEKDISFGTRSIFNIAGPILGVLERGGTLIVDELDKSLHPFVLKGLLRLFKDRTYNKNNAQIISTLHLTDVLEDKIYKTPDFSFVNKTSQQGSFITRLSDIEKRNEVNFRDRYLSGMYLGIPYPYI